MYANYKRYDKNPKKNSLRGLPAYAYSRKVELHTDTNFDHEMNDGSKKNVLKKNFPLNFSEFDLPNEDQISYFEQLMMKSNVSIVLNNLLEDQEFQVIKKKPVSVSSKIFKDTPLSSNSSDTLPFYKICFDIIEEPIKNTAKWKLCLIAEYSTEIRCEFQQIYVHMLSYYANYMKKVDLGVLETCNRIVGYGQAVTESEQFNLTIKDDYLMALQIFILLKHVLSNQNELIFKQIMETLEMWKHHTQKMITNPKLYKFSQNCASSDMTELLGYLICNYLKIRHYFEVCFTLMTTNKENTKNQQVKDDMLCKYWHSMITSPQKVDF